MTQRFSYGYSLQLDTVTQTFFFANRALSLF